MSRLLSWFRGHAGRRRVFVLVGSLLLSFVPLVGTLSYFSALLLAPILSLLAIGIGVDGWAVPPRDDRSGWMQIRDVVAQSWRELVWLLVLPWAALTLGQLWTRNCDYLSGVAWYLVGPVCSAVLGWCAGICAGSIHAARWRRWLLGALPFLFCTSVALARLYREPVVFAYDPFWGYFAGSLYDEAVAITATFGWFRAYNALAAAASLLFLAWFLDSRSSRPTALGRRVVAVFALMIGVTIGWHADSYGFSTTLRSATETLSLRRETEHFVIYYAPRSQTAREIDAVAAEHEFAWARLANILGREPDWKIESFVFANGRQKQAVFGADNVEISLPWKHQIYLHHQAFPHGALHHELAHAFGATFGDPIFGLSPAVGLIEGLANALAPRAAHGLDLHDQAAVLDRLDKRPELADIIGLGFWRHASSRAYTTAGSFCAWLIETRGIALMMELYRQGGGFQQIYGTSLEQLEQQWLAFLRERPIEDADVAAMAQRFKRGSIFARACAHRVANLRVEAKRELDRGRIDEAVALLDALCDLEPEEYRHRETLAYTLAAVERYASAVDVLMHTTELDDLTDTANASLAELRGDVALKTGAFDEALAYYERALHYPLGERDVRVLEIKRLAAADPVVAASVIDYFALFELDADGRATSIVRVASAAELARDPRYEAIGNYLLGHQLLGVERPDLAVAPLRRAIGARPPTRVPLPGEDLVRQAHLALVEALVLTGDHNGASEVLARLANTTSLPTEAGSSSMHHRSGDELTYALWRERIAFFARYPDAPRTRAYPRRDPTSDKTETSDATP